MGFPEQAIFLAKIAGKWNALNAEIDGGPVTLVSSTLTISATGALSGPYCDSLRPCLLVPSGYASRAHPSGSFEMFSTINSDIDRVFAHRSGAAS